MKGDPGNDESKLDRDIDLNIDPGEPIASLAGFQNETSSGFLSRFRRAIQRRTTVGQLTTFATSTPLVVLVEFWLILVDQFSPKNTRKDGRREDKTS